MSIHDPEVLKKTDPDNPLGPAEVSMSPIQVVMSPEHLPSEDVLNATVKVVRELALKAGLPTNSEIIRAHHPEAVDLPESRTEPVRDEHRGVGGKPLPIPDDCPVCGGRFVVSCRCVRSDRSCAAGHHWHKCPAHGRVVIGRGDHGSPRCSCGEGSEHVAPPRESRGQERDEKLRKHGLKPAREEFTNCERSHGAFLLEGYDRAMDAALPLLEEKDARVREQAEAAALAVEDVEMVLRTERLGCVTKATLEGLVGDLKKITEKRDV